MAQMTGKIVIEATEKGISCNTELRNVGFEEKIHIVAIVLRLLDLKDANEIAMFCSLAGAANAANAFNSTETRLRFRRSKEIKTKTATRANSPLAHVGMYECRISYIYNFLSIYF